METAKVMKGKGAKDNFVPTSEDVDELLDIEDKGAQRRPQQEMEQQHVLTEKSSNSSESAHKEDLRRNSFSKILRTSRPRKEAEKAESPTNSAAPNQRVIRFRIGSILTRSSEETNPQKRNAIRRSPQSRPRSSRNDQPGREKQNAQWIPRSTSSQEGLPRVSSLKRISLPRSSSERQYGTDVLRALRVSPRNGSRRWQGDDFGIPEQEEEGELDSFFRFMEECAQAVWAVLREIPVFFSRLPDMTMDILKQLIPVLRQPTVPLIEGPHNEEGPP